MESLFVSYSFSKREDRAILGRIEELARSFELSLKVGIDLGGGDIDRAVADLIKQSDAVIGLATRRDQLAEGDWTTHNWIGDELTTARNFGKPTIMLLEGGVQMAGMGQNHEHILFDRGNLDSALLKLARTLSIWKSAAGKRLKVQLLPEDLDQEVETSIFKYQFVEQGLRKGWNEIDPIREPGGLYLNLNGVRDGYLIEIEVTPRGDDPTRKSVATAQTTTIEVN